MQPINWYVNRLKAMSPAEIATRVRRQAQFAFEKAGVGLARPGVPRAAGAVYSWPVPQGTDPAPYVSVADCIVAGQFEYFGERFDLSAGINWNADPKSGVVAPLSFGKTLNYRDNRLVGDIKYVWEPSRHVDLLPLAQAYALTGDRRFTDAIRALVSSWIEQCTYPLGPNWCSSLELGIRLINWQFAYILTGGSNSPMFEGSEGQHFQDNWSRSVFQHVHFIMGHLSSHSSANNHLIGELVGAYVAASAWPLWPEMDRWRDQARAGIVEQAKAQTYPDGVNKEQAVSYQQFVMYFLLLAGLVGERSNQSFGRNFWQSLRRMTAYVDALLDVGGRVPNIGDEDDGIVFKLDRPNFDPFRALLGIGGHLFDEPAWTTRFPEDAVTAQWLCSDLEPVLPPEDVADQRGFPDGGYFLLGSNLGSAAEVRLVVDAGPLGFLSIAAHGHADCLSMTLSVAGEELLIDPGTYCYHSQRDWRDYFRGTSAHNTVRIDGLDQSTISGPFMWDQKAEATLVRFESSDAEDLIIARHDGYQRLNDPVQHEREIRFDKVRGQIDIFDRISCRAQHRVERFWQVSEKCAVLVQGAAAQIRSQTAAIRLEDVGGDRPPIEFRGSTEPKAGWISRSFGQKDPTSTLVFEDQLSADTTLHTRITLI